MLILAALIFARRLDSFSNISLAISDDFDNFIEDLDDVEVVNLLTRASVKSSDVVLQVVVLL